MSSRATEVLGEKSSLEERDLELQLEVSFVARSLENICETNLGVDNSFAEAAVSSSRRAAESSL